MIPEDINLLNHVNFFRWNDTRSQPKTMSIAMNGQWTFTSMEKST